MSWWVMKMMNILALMTSKDLVNIHLNCAEGNFYKCRCSNSRVIITGISLLIHGIWKKRRLYYVKTYTIALRRVVLFRKASHHRLQRSRLSYIQLVCCWKRYDMVVRDVGGSGSVKLRSIKGTVTRPKIHERIKQSGEKPHLYQQCYYHLFDTICQMTWIQQYQVTPSVGNCAEVSTSI